MIHLIGNTLVAHIIFALVAAVTSEAPKISPEYHSCIEKAESEALARHNIESSDPLYRSAQLGCLMIKDGQFLNALVKCCEKEDMRCFFANISEEKLEGMIEEAELKLSLMSEEQRLEKIAK